MATVSEIITEHLPSFCYKKKPLRPAGAVVHFVSARNVLPEDPFNREAILEILKKYRVSAHTLIERDGTEIELVPKEYIAFHAGKSRMNGRDWCNNFTFGYELAGGIGWDYTDDQIITLGTSLAQDMTEHQFSLDWVQGHDKVRQDWNDAHPDNPGKKKRDPGDHFPWPALNDMLAGVSNAIKNNN